MCMCACCSVSTQVWKPRIQFETFSYLPPLSDDDIKKQIAYMLRKGLTPCLEFDCAERSFAKEQPAYGPGFYYNRYWMMWKLPMFGCTDGDQVLQEVANCKKEYPGALLYYESTTLTPSLRSVCVCVCVLEGEMR